MQSRLARENRLFLACMVAVLLTAVALRLFAITNIPPGLTHDEADHGITALSILQGTRAVYFTIGHGREPLYDYVTALVMAGIGPTFLAGRLTAVFASLLTISGMAAWVRRAFDWQTAVFTAAGLAVSFWPLMAARQSLRSILLPLLFVLTVYFFWHGLWRGSWRAAEASSRITHHASRPTDYRLPITDYATAGLFLGLTFYTYIPARVLWLVFPLTLAYMALAAGPLFHKTWRGVLFMLVLAGAVALPLLLYLAAHPEAEVRIRELSGPLTAVTQGHLSPLWQNAREGVGILFWRGDDFWRYNVPERPLLGPAWALLFGGGLVMAGWWVVRPLIRRQPDDNLRGTAVFLALCWLLLGLAPVLVTGPSLSTTQAMGMLPVLFLFPALAIREIGRFGDWRWGDWKLHKLLVLSCVLLFMGTAVITARDYFVTWAHTPEVRVQYEAAMTAVMHYLNEQDVTDVAISTITPGQYHTPALAQMTLTHDNVSPRWFDGRTGLLIPHAPDALIILSGFAPLPDTLQGYLDTAVPLSTILQPVTDLDRPLMVYQLDGDGWLAEHRPSVTFNPPIQFGDAAELEGYDLSQREFSPGETLQLITFWQLVTPTPDIRLFTHLTGVNGVPLAQTDLLAAPGESWASGDRLLQLHEITLPPDMPPGNYPLTVGWYTCQDTDCQHTQRLLTPTGQDYFTLEEVTILDKVTR